MLVAGRDVAELPAPTRGRPGCGPAEAPGSVRSRRASSRRHWTVMSVDRLSERSGRARSESCDHRAVERRGERRVAARFVPSPSRPHSTAPLIGLHSMPAALTAAPLLQDSPAIDTGTTAWMLTSTALVLLMIPGLAMFYGGLVRTKNVLGTMMHSFAAMAIAIWVAGLHLLGPTVGGVIDGTSKVLPASTPRSWRAASPSTSSRCSRASSRSSRRRSSRGPSPICASAATASSRCGAFSSTTRSRTSCGAVFTATPSISPVAP